MNPMRAWFGLKKLLPTGPVLTAQQRTASWGAPAPSAARYTGPPRSACPVLPLLPFGVTYDLDLVLVSRHPDWDMHELAAIQTSDGPIWLAKDAHRGTLDQSIVADLPGLDTFLPELPVARHHHPLEIEDRSTDAHIDLTASYTNPKGQHTRLSYQGPWPAGPQRKRNGSTMGHSRRQLMAALDVSHKSFARRAAIAYNGRPTPLKRLAGLLPFAVALKQTQGGLATGHFTIAPDGPQRWTTTHHRPDAPDATLSWTSNTGPNGTEVTTSHPLRSIHAHFLTPQPDQLELHRVEVKQWPQTQAPTMALTLDRALPDLRRPFEGRHTSAFVIDIGTQKSHATGTLTAWWHADGPRLDLTPQHPWWVADRPMQSRARFLDTGAVEVLIERTDAAC